MKKFTLIALFISSLGWAQAQSYELGGPAGKDTFNLIDAQGKKQGKWIVYGKHKPGTCYAADPKVEEGKYQENRKTSCRTVGSHAHQTFKEWSDWLRHQSLTKG